MPAELDIEATLLARIAKGQEPALAMFYDRLSPLAYGLALRIVRDPALAEETVQDAFLRVWRNAEQYTADRGKPRPWFLRIVRNLAIDAVRSRDARDRIADAAGDEPQDTPARPDELVADAQVAYRVRRELAALPVEQRTAIERAYFDGLSHSQIAARDQTPLGTVKTRIRDGVLRLRAAFRGEALDG